MHFETQSRNINNLAHATQAKPLKSGEMYVTVTARQTAWGDWQFGFVAHFLEIGEPRKLDLTVTFL